MFGWANIQNQILFVGVFEREIFFFDLRVNWEVLLVIIANIISYKFNPESNHIKLFFTVSHIRIKYLFFTFGLFHSKNQLQ